MREIKFRGIREKTGEWVYGYLVMREEPFLHDIVSPIGNQSSCTWSIKRGSEGQYTGRKGKDGVEVYDGDIVRDKLGKDFSISFNQEFCAFFLYPTEDPEEFMAFYPNINLTVIGNRYENPELLKEEPTC